MRLEKTENSCTFNYEDNLKVQNMVSSIVEDFTDRQNTLVEKLVKERLSGFGITFKNDSDFYDFVKHNLSASYSQKETIIYFQNKPLLTYWFEMQPARIIEPPHTLTANFYYK